MFPKPQVVIVLLNWNGASDTMDCIRSLLASDEQDFLIVICDNASSDGSFSQLTEWSATAFPAETAIWTLGDAPATAKLIFIQTGANLGFAGGCNVGLRYALECTQADYIWLLNNDTVVDPKALDYQMAAMQERPLVGILGSTLLFYDEPDMVQAPGGYGFNFWTSRVIPLLRNANLAVLPAERTIEAGLVYVSGASMFVRRTFLEAVGLLNEQYFLYFEELDWVIRGRPGFCLGYCAASRVWHKEGRSIGSHRQSNQRSEFSEQYLARNRVLFTKTYMRSRLIVALPWIAAVGLARLLKGQGKLAWVLWKGAWTGLWTPPLPPPAVNVWPLTMRAQAAGRPPTSA